MNLIQRLIVAGMGMSLAAGMAVAQTNVDAATQVKRDGQVILPERPTATDAANATTATLRPSRPERPNLPPEVQARVERLKQEARAYLARQQLLKKQLQGASDKDRAAIRAQIRELQQEWSEQAKALRKEFKERQAELADKLPAYRELLDNARTRTVQDAAGGHSRRGDD
jgi:hypothetical protein